MRPAFLEITEVSPETYNILWRVPARGEARISLSVQFVEDVEVVSEPVTAFSGGADVTRWTIQRSGGLAGTPLRIKGLESTYTDALIRVSLIDLEPQTIMLNPENPGLTIADKPGAGEVAVTYLRLGIEHILLGVDHLLFVLGLLLIVDRRWMLVKTVTSFTIAHSITLGLSTFAVIQVEEVPLNAAIALSILFLGPEIARKWRGGSSFTLRHPWIVAFAFGLLHGIGFASGLSLNGVPRPEIPAALLFFNIGVEVGQLAFVFLALAVAKSIRILELNRPSWVLKLPGYAVGSLGAFWTCQRVWPILFS